MDLITVTVDGVHRHLRTVTHEEAMEFAKKHNLAFLEVRRVFNVVREGLHRHTFPGLFYVGVFRGGVLICCLLPTKPGRRTVPFFF